MGGKKKLLPLSLLQSYWGKMANRDKGQTGQIPSLQDKYSPIASAILALRNTIKLLEEKACKTVHFWFHPKTGCPEPQV